MAKPAFFSTPAKLRAWLAKNGETKDELLVGFYKKATGKPSITWPESVDEALCFGWIDGIRRRIDDASYSIRFTPRRPNSNWSARNIERVKVLTKTNRMEPLGVRAYSRMSENKSSRYAYEQQNVNLSQKYEKLIQSNKIAWSHFQSLPASYKKPSIWWIESAKKEETRLRRLEKLIECSAKQQVLPQFLKPIRPKKKKYPRP